jgi:hypothetical protein
MIQFNSFAIFGAFVSLLPLSLGCMRHNAPVSSLPTQPAAERELPQAETSLLRVDHLENGKTVSRFMVAFNDDTGSAKPDGFSWQFTGLNSTSGWATSPDGQSWTRKQQVTATPALVAQGLNALHGDPWLAGWNSADPASPSIVLYASIGQAGLHRFGPPWFLVVARSIDSGVSFQAPVIVLGPQQALPDGPKIAVTGDGARAIVAWDGPGIRYKVLSDLRGANMTIPTDAAGVHPASASDIASPPPGNCNFQGVPILHPLVAASQHTFYLAQHVFYSANAQGCQSTQRFEVYRADAATLAAQAANAPTPFERVLSVADPIGDTEVAGQNIANGTFAMDFDRGGLGMSLAVGRDSGGDYVLLVAQRKGMVNGENSHNEVVQFRLAGADTCDAANHKGDLDSCGIVNMAPVPVHSLTRLGFYEVKPQVFVGKVPDGGSLDNRVGIVWYTQPYRGQQGNNITGEMVARTIVEAVVSTDGGQNYTSPMSLVSKDDGPGPTTDPSIGDFFHPCQFQQGDPVGYFGEYIGGAFVDTATTQVTATWADSREGCLAQSSPGTFHMHVWAGWRQPPPVIPTNPCGGTLPLLHPPGFPCQDAGQCGHYRCVGTDAVTCDTSSGLRNECGGCTPLPLPVSGHGRGDPCICETPGRQDGILVCSPNKNSLICCSCNSAPGCGPGSP